MTKGAAYAIFPHITAAHLARLTTMLEAEDKKVLTFPSEDVKKFKELHPAHGAFTWFCREALHRYVSLHHADPGELVEQAVKGIEVPAQMDDL